MLRCWHPSPKLRPKPQDLISSIIRFQADNQLYKVNLGEFVQGHLSARKTRLMINYKPVDGLALNKTLSDLDLSELIIPYPGAQYLRPIEDEQNKYSDNYMLVHSYTLEFYKNGYNKEYLVSLFKWRCGKFFTRSYIIFYLMLIFLVISSLTSVVVHFNSERILVDGNSVENKVGSNFYACRMSEQFLFESTDFITEGFKVNSCLPNFYRYSAMIDLSQENIIFQKLGRSYREFHDPDLSEIPYLPGKSNLTHATFSFKDTVFITDTFWLVEAYELPKYAIPQYSVFEWFCMRVNQNQVCNVEDFEEDFYFGVTNTIEWGEVPGVVSKNRKIMDFSIGSWSYSTLDFNYVQFTGKLIKPPILYMLIRTKTITHASKI